MRRQYPYPGGAPDKDRATARAELAGWLQTQSALHKGGKAMPELDTKVPEIAVPH